MAVGKLKCKQVEGGSCEMDNEWKVWSIVRSVCEWEMVPSSCDGGSLCGESANYCIINISTSWHNK